MNAEGRNEETERQDAEAPQEAVATPVEAAPEELPGELQVWRDFAEKYGRQTLTALIVVAVVAGGIRLYRNRTQAKAEEALIELFKANTLSERQAWIERYPKAAVAPIGQIRLAAAQYAAGNYARARDAYEAFLKNHADNPLAPMAQMGLAHSLEAAGLTEPALKAFEAFLKDRPKHFLHAEAVVGKSRCLLLLGRTDEARTVCEDFISAHTGDEAASRVDDWLKRLNRMVKRGPITMPSAAMPLNLAIPDATVSTNVIDLTGVTPPAAPATNAPAVPAP